MSKKIEFLKGAIGFVAGLGVSQIVNGIVASTTPTDTNYQKATVAAGRLAIGMLVNDLVRQHTDAKVDSAVAWWQKTISEAKAKSINPPADPSSDQ
jgi:hypothetical protein